MPRHVRERGPRQLTVKVEFEREPPTIFDIEEFKVLVMAAYSAILGQSVPTYTIETFDANTRKGTIVCDAKDLSLLWAALSVYGQHLGQNMAFHYFAIKE